jgi:hypothetical protein
MLFAQMLRAYECDWGSVVKAASGMSLSRIWAVVTQGPMESHSEVVTQGPMESHSEVVTQGPMESHSEVVTQGPMESHSEVVTQGHVGSHSEVVTQGHMESHSEVAGVHYSDAQRVRTESCQQKCRDDA